MIPLYGSHIHTNQRRYDMRTSITICYAIDCNCSWGTHVVPSLHTNQRRYDMSGAMCAIIMDSGHMLCIICTTLSCRIVHPLHTNWYGCGETHPPLTLLQMVVGSRLHLPGVPTVLTDDEIFSDESYDWLAPLMLLSILPVDSICR